MDSVWHGIVHALGIAFSMTWQVTWSLILGFTLSAVIEALVKKSTIASLLPDDRPRSLATATGLGAASSSCSYAAVALARSLFRKGADFTAAMARLKSGEAPDVVLDDRFVEAFTIAGNADDCRARAAAYAAAGVTELALTFF